MVLDGITKVARTVGGFPTARTEFRFGGCSEPLLLGGSCSHRSNRWPCGHSACVALAYGGTSFLSVWSWVTTAHCSLCGRPACQRRTDSPYPGRSVCQDRLAGSRGAPHAQSFSSCDGDAAAQSGGWDETVARHLRGPLQPPIQVFRAPVQRLLQDVEMDCDRVADGIVDICLPSAVPAATAEKQRLIFQLFPPHRFPRRISQPGAHAGNISAVNVSDSLLAFFGLSWKP